MIRIVTVERSLGTHGRAVAREVGRLLDWPVLDDHDVVARIADRLGASKEEVEALDEHVPSLAERVGAALAGASPEVVLPPDVPELDEARVADLAEEILRGAAADPPVVIVGHGGMCLFGDRDDALAVRVVAPFGTRVAAVRDRLGISEEAAREEVRADDSDRRTFIRRRFGVDRDDPTLYHLVVNAGWLDSAAIGRTVERLVGRRPGR